MPYNLIEETWIPVRRESGMVERIAPWQIVETEDPPVRIQSGRPDFDAALLEFLIGLVQTVFTPNDTSEWESVYEQGCPTKGLMTRMLTVREAFFLDGDGPRFMQDLTVHRDERVEKKPVEELLIDRGTARDSSLFAKSGGFGELGLPAAAAAILTMQIFAPQGGRGQCVSIRGGGPLSVTLQDRRLWETVWCNVLTRSDLENLPGDRVRNEVADRMPWMGPTRTSEKGKPGTFPEHVHPLHHYWGLPRRFRLVVDPEAIGTCAIYGDHRVPVVRVFHSRPDGTSYEGSFRHPLTPYTRLRAGDWNPKKGDKAGVPYRDWPLLTLGSETLLPPKVVEAFILQERWRSAPIHRIAVRGYAMKIMKPLRFVEAEAPLLHASSTTLDELRTDASGLVAASEDVRRTLSSQVKSAWKDRPLDQSGEVETRVDPALWSGSENSFHNAVRGIAAAIEGGRQELRAAEKRAFLRALQREAIRVFDDLCPLDVESGPDNLARRVRARRDLERHTDPEGNALLAHVGLAPPTEFRRGRFNRKPKRKEGRA